MGWVQRIDYIVEREESHWTVSFQSERCGHFGCRRDALKAALEDAARVRRLGHEVRVLVRYEDGRLRDVHSPSPGLGAAGTPTPAPAH